MSETTADIRNRRLASAINCERERAYNMMTDAEVKLDNAVAAAKAGALGDLVRAARRYSRARSYWQTLVLVDTDAADVRQAIERVRDAALDRAANPDIDPAPEAIPGVARAAARLNEILKWGGDC